MRTASASLLVLVVLLSACGESNPPPKTDAAASAHSEFVGTWQASGTFPGGCSDLECPAQFSFRLQLRASGGCELRGQTRSYRSDPATGEWGYEPWKPYRSVQTSCSWKTPDDWHVQLTLKNSKGWSGVLNGSILEFTSPAPERLRVHFSRVTE